MTRIITSLLDDDLYKFTMGAVVFHNFPRTKARYEFINRGGTQFPEGFAVELLKQIQELSFIRLSREEGDYLDTLPYMRPTYVSWLRGYSHDPSEVTVEQVGGELRVAIEGFWFRTIFWEVKLMAIISELYFEMTGATLAPDWADRIEAKAKALNEGGAQWNDFGTRRRRAKMVHAKVVEVMKNFKGFLGTSNVQMAMLYGVTPTGTSAHEAMMAMGALVGPWYANTEWLKHWRNYYRDGLSIALTDTFTTDVFLKHWGKYEAREWAGLRQDSGCPHVWANKIIDHYLALEVPTKDKKLVFSDNLDVAKGLVLTRDYKDIAIPILGIGTNFTNDTFSNEQKAAGIKPLNMVIKLTEVMFNQTDGWKGTVKLSDSPGKHTGKKEDIENVKALLKIV